MRRERRFLLTVWNDGEGTAHRARLEPLRGGPTVLVAVLADLHLHLRAALDAGRGAPKGAVDGAGGDAAGGDAAGADSGGADSGGADAAGADARVGARSDRIATPAGPATARPPPLPARPPRISRP